MPEPETTTEEHNTRHTDRIEIGRKVSAAGHEFFESLGEVDENLMYLAGEFRAANEDYVSNHSGKRETNEAVDMLRNGFTTNQKRMLERVRDRLQRQVAAQNAECKFKFEFHEWDDECTLLCPRCGGHYLHHEVIEVFERDEDAKKGIHTIITRDHVDVKYDSLGGNPSSRRHGFKIKFDCEYCGNPLTLEVSQHKGETLVAWDI